MDLKQAMTTRHSVRKFSDKEISVSDVEHIVELAGKGPSWANVQPVRYNCILSRALKEQLALTSDYNRRYMEGAAAVVVISARLNLSGADETGTLYYHSSKEWTMFDAGIAGYGFCLAAHDLGFGTVILGDFDGDAVRSAIQLPETEDVIALIALGCPAKLPRGPEKHDVSKILRFY